MSKFWNYVKRHAYGACTILAVLLCAVGSLLANAVQTDFSNVTKENLVIESDSGHRLAIDMLKPKSVTNKNPAPAIVFAHGGNGNKERFDFYQVEWARRGFVVFSFDLYGHGESEVLNTTDWLVNGRGLYDTVRYASRLPFVNANKIAVSGHSRGGNTVHETMALDNKAKKPLIKAVLYVSRDAIYKDAETQGFGYVPGKTTSAQGASQKNGKYFNYYGSRDVGIVAGKWDQYSFKEVDPKTHKMLPNPDYLKHNNAKAFLHFGATPTASTPDGMSGKWYTKTIDGKKAGHIVYLHNGFHGSQLFEGGSVTSAVDFMDKALNMPTTLKPANHIYQWKIVGGALGFFGMFMFAVFCSLWLSQKYMFREANEGKATMRIAANYKGSKAWSWGTMIVNALLAAGSTLVLYFLNADTHIGNFFRQGQPLFSGLMCAVSAVFTGIVTLIWYYCFAKKNGLSLDEIDIKTSWRKLWKTVVLALAVVGGVLLLVWGAQYFCKTNYGFLYWCILPFPAYKITEMLKLLPIFLVAYVMSSVFINCLNYNTAFSKNKTVNMFIMAFMNAGVPIIISLIGWGRFMVTGVNDLFGAAYTRIIDGIFQTIFMLLVTPITARKIYEKTKNPYLGGVINAFLALIIACVNSQIAYPA